MLHCLVLLQKPENRLAAAFVNYLKTKSCVNHMECKQNNFIFIFLLSLTASVV